MSINNETPATSNNLPLPHILFAVQDGETQFSFYFRGLDETASTPKGAVGIFGISLYEIGIEADIVFSLPLEELVSFYSSLRECCKNVNGSSSINMESHESVHLTITFDNLGRCELKGFVRNLYSGNTSVIHFSLECDQYDFLISLPSFQEFFDAYHIFI